MNTPIIFIIFNRPNVTQKVFNSIKKAKPKKLYIIADGPRSNNTSDINLCKQTRKIINQINWPCEVIKDFSDINLGCKNRIASGITSAFNFFDRAIILEDDCLPNDSFFMFCEEILEKYKNNNKIMSVTGDNFLFNKKYLAKEDSYYFSKYPNIWGWATWKRAWKFYDVSMSSWPTVKLEKRFNSNWTTVFDNAYNGKVNTWDIQWAYTCMCRQGLTVVPRYNLVSNIGFGKGSTHTKIISPTANMKTAPMTFPLKHPSNIVPLTNADNYSRSHFTHIGIVRDIILNFLNLLYD